MEISLLIISAFTVCLMKRTEKIIFYCGIFAPTGGIEEFTAEFAELLLETGYRVELICAARSSPLLERIRKRGGIIHRIPWIWGCRWRIPATLLLLPGVWFARNADLLVLQKAFPRYHLRWVGPRAAKLFISSYNPADEFTDTAKYQPFFTYIDVFFVQCSAFLKMLPALGFRGRSNVIPLLPPKITGMLDTGNSTPLTDRVCRIGMMGRLEEQKNPLYAVHIVAELQKLRPQLRIEFHVYGDGRCRKAMEQAAQKYGVNCVFHGAYLRNQAAEIVSANHFFLICSRTEGQCIAALEILAGGRPLFSTAVGALPEILSDPVRGSLIAMANPEQAAVRIAEFMKRPEFGDARRIIKSYESVFSREKVRKQYLNEINEILKRRKG